MRASAARGFGRGFDLLRIGAEYQATKKVSIGAFFRQVNDGLDVALDNTTAVGLNRGLYTNGQAFGMQAKIVLRP